MSRKPEIAPPPNTSDLLSRLNSFLPELRDANASLKQRINEQGQGAVDIETLSSPNSEDDDSSDTETDVGNKGKKKRQVIEMNLGLGVLEEMRPDADENENESESEDEDEDAMEEDAKGALESLLHSSKPHDNAPRGKPSIQEVTDSASAPTPSTQGTKRQAEDSVEDLKGVVENSKRHGKGPRDGQV